MDLKADMIQIQINEDDPIHGIYLTFTASGGDLDDGKGIKTIFKCCKFSKQHFYFDQNASF